MGTRSATVHGNKADNVITGHYFGPRGEHANMFRGDDITQTESDRITVKAGAGDDIIDLSARLYYGHPSDLFYLYGDDGNDEITVYESGFTQHGGYTLYGGSGDDTLDYTGVLQVLMDGGPGDDVLYLFAHALPEYSLGPIINDQILTGGTGRDSFNVIPLNVDSRVTITDFELGYDTLDISDSSDVIPRFELWPLVEDPNLVLTDGDNGLTLQYYRLDINDRSLTLAVTITLQGVQLEDLRPDDVPAIDGTARNDRITSDFTDGDGDGFTDEMDLVFAGAGNDRIWLGNSADIVFGQGGHDAILAQAGRHRINGGDGQDKLSAMHGICTLEGAAGDDILRVAAHSGSHHVMSGGADADTFMILSRSNGHRSTVTITDFDPTEDKLFILGNQIDIHNLPDDILATTDYKGWLILQFGDDELLTLRGIEYDIAI